MQGIVLLPIMLGTIVVLLPVLCLGILSFDQLIGLQHSKFETEWHKDGRPIGYFRHPPGGSLFARTRVTIKWLLVTPDWIASDERALQLLKRRRICFVVWNVGMLAIVGMLVAFVVLSQRPNGEPPDKARPRSAISFEDERASSRTAVFGHRTLFTQAIGRE